MQTTIERAEGKNKILWWKNCVLWRWIRVEQKKWRETAEKEWEIRKRDKKEYVELKQPEIGAKIAWACYEN